MEKLVFSSENLNLELIKEKVKAGSIVIYPTDTVYGVGADIFSLAGIERIYAAKERNFTSPLIALISDRKYVEEIAYIDEENRDKVQALMENFWPGGLTIILRKKDVVPGIMVSNGETVGVRIPNHKISMEIIESVGGIMPTTSANISGEKTPRSFEELSQVFKERVDILIDGGASPLGTESTIIDMSKNTPKILREGSISKSEIEKVIGKF